jgi:hypothetical protein
MSKFDTGVSREEMLSVIKRAVAGSVPYLINHNAFMISSASWSELADIADPRLRGLDHLMERSARGEKITEADIEAIFADDAPQVHGGEVDKTTGKCLIQFYETSWVLEKRTGGFAGDSKVTAVQVTSLHAIPVRGITRSKKKQCSDIFWSDDGCMDGYQVHLINVPNGLFKQLPEQESTNG